MVSDNTTIKRRKFLKATAAGVTGGLMIGSAGAKPTRKIVGLGNSRGVRAAKAQANSVHRELDFGHVGKAVAGNFSDNAIKALKKNHNVRYVEDDGLMHAIGGPPGSCDPWPDCKDGGGGGGDTSETLPWGIDRVDAEVAHSNGETGNGSDVAIIDTGIDSDHPDLQANLGKGYAVVKCRGGSCNTNWDDDEGHGTHCAGIADAVDNSEGVVGVSTEATLHAVKVLDKRGSGSFSDIAEGIRWVADQGYDVGSMSLGASSGSQTVKDACQYAYDKGVLLVGAAGNSGPCTDCVGYPAAYSTVMAVSSTAKDDSLSDFSSTGPEVEIAAPGSNIYSTYKGGGYDTLSGTSMACPHVSGAGGQLMANGKSNQQARDTLNSSAEDIGLSSNEQGNGLLDVASALGLDSSNN